LAVALFSAFVLGAIWRVAQQQDKAAVAESVEIAGSVIDAFERHLRRVASDHAFANAELAGPLQELDAQWAHERLGGHVTEEHGVRLALVLDAERRTAFAAVDGQVQDEFDAGRLQEGAAALLEAARREAGEAEPDAVSGFIRMDGEIH